jgi:replication initiation protein RepC
MNPQNISGNPDQNERHKQNSNTKHQNELEPSFDTKQGERSADKQSEYEEHRPASYDRQDRDREHTPVSYQRKVLDAVEKETGIKPFPLGMVLSACPEIQNYGPASTIGSWRELMAAAVVVRSMLGVSPSAYEEACAVMGPENAATVIACILERAGHINSAGGYLRDLTRRAERGEFSLGPVLMAQMRANGQDAVRRA